MKKNMGSFKINISAIWSIVLFGLMTRNANGDQKFYGPSDQPEAFFNGSSYIRLHTTINLKKQMSFSFRTCSGGELLSQRHKENTFALTVRPEGLLFTANTSAKNFSQIMRADFQDNRWHEVYFLFQFGNLTLIVDDSSVQLANATFQSELINSPDFYNEGAVLIVGKRYVGCMLEGPSLVFDKTLIQPHSVVFGKCPIPLGSCSTIGKETNKIQPVDHCATGPCMMHGLCRNEFNTYSCECSPRYAGKNCEIDLGSPCEKVPATCKNGAACIDDPSGNFKCNCPAGFTGKTCENEIKVSPYCQSSPCLNGGTCFVSEEDGVSTKCTCPAGFFGEKCEVNINECEINPCKNGGTCIDGPNNFTCDCSKTGYEGPTCEDNINECLQSKPCLNRGICFDTYGTYKCQCADGFEGFRCENKMYDCRKQQCMNHGKCGERQGRFECHCPPGYGGYLCEHELRSTVCDVSFCGSFGDCRDVSGEPTCTCKPEYGGTYPNCNVNCVTVPCLHGGSCLQNSQGTFNCSCPTGYSGDRCQNPVESCSPTKCLNDGTCYDTANGFLCNCTHSWMGQYCERPFNVCELKVCLNNATCIAQADPQQFLCDCLPGFEGANCEVNVDDCVDVECPPGKTCVDLVESYECQCPPGFSGDNCQFAGDACAPNPCQNGGQCNPNGHQTGKNYTCTCTNGYQGINCDKDVNECELPGLPICNQGICVNLDGSFQCYCKPGFTGERCNLDFDECLSQPCKNNATCLNKVNNYECLCPPGYQGKDCHINIDECASNPCKHGSTCVDGINKFTCVCQAGMTGARCEINIDDCLSQPCQNGAKCIDGLNKYECDCDDTGYKGHHCEINIDDCVSNPCMNGAQCLDLVKDYNCDCFDGYTGKNCEIDVNECESSPCQNNGVCLERSNTTLYDLNLETDLELPKRFKQHFEFHDSAGYECLCVPGVVGVNCEINVNECDSNPCHFGTCVDKIGGYLCECEEGFEGDQCQIDIDECAKYQPCVHGSCIDRRANYYCDCEPGFGGKNCSVELEGCRENPCRNNGTCKPSLHNETVHTFNCTCPHGFHGHTCDTVTTMSLAGNSHIEVNTRREEGHDIQFRFKTTLGDGFLALGQGSTYYILTLVKGRLNLRSSLLNKWDGVFVGSNLNDTHWQKVFVAINSSHLVLSANDEQTIYPINSNDNNESITSFNTTYLGGYPQIYQRFTHNARFLVGCVEDIIVNGEWVLPDARNSTSVNVSFVNVITGCHREPQCKPNPCHSGGHCTDLWSNFSCTCERPHLGHTCQYNYTAATFGYENITDSLVTVTASDAARRAIRSVVDISMFIRTRQSLGQIFYLGSALGSAASLQNESYIAAQLEGGELLVRIQFNGPSEAYTVGGVKLNDGHDHLIQVIRNVTLVQVKLNGTEYFRKTISATGTLDAQVLFLGGQPQLRAVRQTSGEFVKSEAANAIIGPAPAVSTPLSMIHFKGIIQDVQISGDGSKVMVVEFFPLQADELSIPMPFGNVSFDNATVLEGVLSDNSCVILPCHHSGECENTWNDYVCICPRGFKGKDCKDLVFCDLEHCPNGTTCRNLERGFECIANTTFDGETPPLQYTFTRIKSNTENEQFRADSIELTYRTRSWGTVLFAKHQSHYFTIFVYHDEVVAEWNFGNGVEKERFRKDQFDGQWMTLVFTIKDGALLGGFKEHLVDDAQSEAPYFTARNFDLEAFNETFTQGTIYVAGSDNRTFDYWDLIRNGDYNMSAYVTLAETTVPPDTGAIVSNSVDFMDTTLTSYKIDLSKGSDQFKGCLGEIRIGRTLLPYFPRDQLNSSSIHYLQSDFSLMSATHRTLGCQLCYEKDCYNQGTCIDPLNTYKCQCPLGFTANDCSIDINECDSNECQNGATCIDRIGKYECECPLGYDGTHCENDIDECESGPCHNGGSCHNLVGAFRCECPEDYVGKQCEALRLITCENQPCKDGSTCTNEKNEATHNNFTCSCAEGMVGTLCDTPYCLVKSKGCENEGICNTTRGVPFCQCRLGFEGRHCETNVDDCLENPCLNGGTCIDGINRYDCKCPAGFKGSACEEDIDECTSADELCGPDGTCVNTRGSYTCNCQGGMCGNQCKLIDPCLENPCVQGTCQHNCTDETDYVCRCESEWTGKNCTEQNLEASSQEGGINVLYVIIPIAAVILIGLLVVLAVLVNVARSKRATRGTYSPSAQEFSNPRVELDHVLKPPPEERLI